MSTQITDPAQFRKNVVTRLVTRLGGNARRAHNLEVSIYNYAIHEAKTRKILRKWTNRAFITLYVDRWHAVWRNLTPYVMDLIEHRSIRTCQLGELSFYEMNPIKWSLLLDAKHARDKTKYENTAKKIVSQFFCRKCKGCNCTYTCIQIRASDEPMTTFITCQDCGNNWKMG